MAKILTFLLAVAIAIATLTPSSSGPAQGLELDKLAHLLAFGLLVGPMAAQYPKRWPVIWIAALAYGGLIEIVQPYVGRTDEWADLVYDGLGAACGIGLVLIYQQVRRRQNDVAR